MLKKIAYISLITFTFSFFSCASKPKVEETVTPDVTLEESPSEQNEESQEQSSDEEKSAEEYETDDSDLEEALTEDLVEELPELPEEDEQEEEDVTPEEPEIVSEPEVKDEPVASAPVEIKQTADSTASSEEKTSESDYSEIEKAQESTSETDSPAPVDTETTVESETNVSTETVIIEEKPEPGKVEIIPNPSRSITIQKNQLIDIIYPGKGWIYQGNIDEEGNIDSRSRNFIFGGRKLGGVDTSFTLRSRNPGTYLLHFYKNDTLTGNYIDDYLEVIVQNKQNTSTEHILVPNYAEIVPPKASITAEKIKEEKKLQKLAEEKAKQEIEEKKSPEQKSSAYSRTKPEVSSPKDSSIDTIIQTTESAPGSNSPAVKKDVPETKKPAAETKSPAAVKTVDTNEADLEYQNADQLLSTAKKHYDSKEFPKAYTAISKFFDKASSRLDEGLYLRGQILEEKSSVQNIKDAIESYDLVVKNYPASSLWDKANKRSIFLKRFYINIR